MNTPYPCPCASPFRDDPAHDAWMNREENAYRDRLSAQERLAQAELADLLREQDEEREDDDREPREWPEGGGL